MRHLILALIALSTPLKAQFAFTQKENAIELHDGKNLVTAFRTDFRFPYLYPVHSPSGANIVRNWPMKPDVPGEEKDHPHHRGIWLAHGSVNGHDFGPIGRWSNLYQNALTSILEQ